jgi:hypothetical protein
MQGHNHQEIAEMMHMNRGSVYRVLNSPVRNTIYSVLIDGRPYLPG